MLKLVPSTSLHGCSTFSGVFGSSVSSVALDPSLSSIQRFDRSEAILWNLSLQFQPVGHLLCSGSTMSLAKGIVIGSRESSRISDGQLTLDCLDWKLLT